MEVIIKSFSIGTCKNYIPLMLSDYSICESFSCALSLFGLPKEDKIISKSFSLMKAGYGIESVYDETTGRDVDVPIGEFKEFNHKIIHNI